MHGVAGFLANHLDIALPRVTANELQSSGAFLPEEAKESQERFGGSFRSDPQQSLLMFVNLVDDSLVVMALLPLNFIDADGLDLL